MAYWLGSNIYHFKHTKGMVVWDDEQIFSRNGLKIISVAAGSMTHI